MYCADTEGFLRMFKGSLLMNSIKIMLKFMRDAEQSNFAVEIPQSEVVMIEQLHVEDGASGG